MATSALRFAINGAASFRIRITRNSAAFRTTQVISRYNGIGDLPNACGAGSEVDRQRERAGKRGLDPVRGGFGLAIGDLYEGFDKAVTARAIVLILFRP
ncbi:hypothetical protein [Bradyrhizobium sp. Ai1a-2]|uniref:hypothetical protein n=1 Tax=Bradyrhizobium sp. Ai1a-2 TaxID=196490 RepID=UPI0012697F2F|nr:hypothetical protein [Bradyrhizobium sp. Ai1a-2]